MKNRYDTSNRGFQILNEPNRLYHNPLIETIKKYLNDCSSDQTIFLFVPYIKTAVLDKLIDGLSNRIVIVTTWEPHDILTGSSDLELYPFCKEQNIALYVSQNMHLKVYSIGLDSALVATGNISHRGLLPSGNYEVATLVEYLTNEDKLFFEKIRREARLVDDTMYAELKKWSDENRIDLPEQMSLEDIVSKPRKDYFLISSLPMTHSVDELVLGYQNLSTEKEPSEDPETIACIFHDLANYGIEPGLNSDVFMDILSNAFFSHPFIQKIDEFIAPEAYFGRIKEWIQNNCTDVPVPSRRELTGNVQVLLEWFEKLGNGKYVIDVPGARSQRIRKIK